MAISNSVLRILWDKLSIHDVRGFEIAPICGSAPRSRNIRATREAGASVERMGRATDIKQIADGNCSISSSMSIQNTVSKQIALYRKLSTAEVVKKTAGGIWKELDARGIRPRKKTGDVNCIEYILFTGEWQTRTVGDKDVEFTDRYAAIHGLAYSNGDGKDATTLYSPSRIIEIGAEDFAVIETAMDEFETKE